MDFPYRELIHYIWTRSLCTLKGHRFKFLNYDAFQSLKIILMRANSADPDEMQRYAAFHLGLHCLLKYPFRGFQYRKGEWNHFTSLPEREKLLASECQFARDPIMP